MRKIVIGISVTLASMFAMAGGATAASVTCNGTISNTGSGSNNTITCVDTNNVSVTCVNNVVTTNNNNQTATSGNVSAAFNTTVGNVSSGDASNSNTVVVNVGTSCNPVTPAAAPVTPATPPATPPAATTPQSTPAQGGRGAAAPKSTGGAQVVAPTGAVDAGAGGAAVTTSDVLSSIGLASSVALLALGLRTRMPADEL
jgi:hypothetical protein